MSPEHPRKHPLMSHVLLTFIHILSLAVLFLGLPLLLMLPMSGMTSPLYDFTVNIALFAGGTLISGLFVVILVVMLIMFWNRFIRYPSTRSIRSTWHLIVFSSLCLFLTWKGISLCIDYITHFIQTWKDFSTS